MVAFICDACGNTVKKNQVEKHYTTQCRNCSVLSCIDCGVDFPGDSYIKHTSCITEAEKYQGHLYQAKDKENKGDAKQKEWLKQVHDASGGIVDPKLKGILKRLSVYSNIPRKKKKFENFCKNSVNVYDTRTLDQLWDVFNASNQKETNITATDGSEENTSETSEDKEESVKLLNKSDSDLNLNSLEISTEKMTIENGSISDTADISKPGSSYVVEMSNDETESKVTKHNDDDEIVDNGLETIKKLKKKKKKKDKMLNGESNDVNVASSKLSSSEATLNEKCLQNEDSADDKSKRKKGKHKKATTAENKSGNICENELQFKRKSKKRKNECNGNNNDIDKTNDVGVNNDKDMETNQVCKKKEKKKKGRKHKLHDEITEEEIQVKNEKKRKTEHDDNIEVDGKDNDEEEVASPQGRFNWHKVMKTILKECDDHEISVKKLRKKVMSAYQEHGIDHRAATMNESLALFDKKLKNYPKVKISKEVVKLIK